MTTLQIEVGESVFAFTSKAHWINKAQSWCQHHRMNSNNAIALDALGRVCRIGGDFADAERDQSYPITVYRYRPAAELAKQEAP